MILSKSEKEWSKTVVGFVWGTALEIFDKNFYSSKEERNLFLQQNEAAGLLNCLVPYIIYAYDREGNKAKLPFGVFEDENFIITQYQKELIMSNAGEYLLKIELIRDNIYAFWYGLERFELNNEQKHSIFFNTFCEILDERMKVYKKTIFYTSPKYQTVEYNKRNEIYINLYNAIINFSKLNDIHRVDILNQIDYFNNYVEMNEWLKLLDKIGERLRINYKKLVNSLAESAISDPLNGYKFIHKVHTKVSLDRLLRKSERRNTYKEFDKYPINTFEIAKKYHQEITQQFALPQKSMENSIPKIVILTALLEEFNAVKEHLSNPKEIERNNTIYERGLFNMNDTTDAEIILRECGQGNVIAAQETERVIANFNPDYIFFVGIAGSRKPNDFSVGDVIIANKVYSYETGKAEKESFLARPNLTTIAYELEEKIKSLRRNEEWKNRIKGNFDTSSVKADLGVIASGEKLIEHYGSWIGSVLTEHYNDTQAVEMEGFGFAKAAERQGGQQSNIQIAIIRGISDILEKDETTQADKRPENVKKFASATAAACTFALIEKLVSSKKNS